MCWQTLLQVIIYKIVKGCDEEDTGNFNSQRAAAWWKAVIESTSVIPSEPEHQKDEVLSRCSRDHRVKVKSLLELTEGIL